MRLGLTLAAMFGLAARLSAQGAGLPPIDTDRPDFTDATTTVPRGHFQLETGYTYHRGSGASDRAHSFPEALLRVGLTPDVELRIGQNYLVVHPDAPLAESVNGLDDLYLGTKFRLADQHGFKPAVSMEAFTTVPTGSDEISAHTMLPGMALMGSWQGSSPFSLGVELAGSRTVDNYLQAVGSASGQVAITKQVQGYVEWFTFQPVRPPSGVIVSDQQYTGTGVLVLLSNNVQVDGRITFGLNDASDKYAFGVGFSIRR